MSSPNYNNTKVAFDSIEDALYHAIAWTPPEPPVRNRSELAADVDLWWTASEVKAEEKRRKSRSSGFTSKKDKNRMLWFLVDEHGERLPDDELSSLRGWSRSIWRLFLRLGIAPDKWMLADAFVLRFYEAAMCWRCNALALCDNFHKVHKIAYIDYASWHKKALAGRDDDQNDDDDEAVLNDGDGDELPAVQRAQTQPINFRKRCAELAFISTRNTFIGLQSSSPAQSTVTGASAGKRIKTSNTSRPAADRPRPTASTRTNTRRTDVPSNRNPAADADTSTDWWMDTGADGLDPRKAHLLRLRSC